MTDLPIPTLGRIVWVRHPSLDMETAAIVTRVWSDTLINVMAFKDAVGPVPITSLTLDQEQENPDHGWRWMPYQIGK